MCVILFMGRRYNLRLLFVFYDMVDNPKFYSIIETDVPGTNVYLKKRGNICEYL